MFFALLIGQYVVRLCRILGPFRPCYITTWAVSQKKRRKEHVLLDTLELFRSITIVVAAPLEQVTQEDTRKQSLK